MNTLLEEATAQLEADSAHSVRRACWLARTALQELIDEMLEAKHISAERASERGKLSCLEGAYVDDRHLAFKAEYVWNRLSEACHQHAYHLAPTYTEAQELIRLVTELDGSTERSLPSAPPPDGGAVRRPVRRSE